MVLLIKIFFLATTSIMRIVTICIQDTLLPSTGADPGFWKGVRVCLGGGGRGGGVGLYVC